MDTFPERKVSRRRGAEAPSYLALRRRRHCPDQIRATWITLNAGPTGRRTAPQPRCRARSRPPRQTYLGATPLQATLSRRTKEEMQKQKTKMPWLSGRRRTAFPCSFLTRVVRYLVKTTGTDQSESTFVIGPTQLMHGLDEGPRVFRRNIGMNPMPEIEDVAGPLAIALQYPCHLGTNTIG